MQPKQQQAHSHTSPNNPNQPGGQKYQKDHFIITSTTLRKLQKTKIIPSQITPINLNTNQLRHQKATQGCKYLLISNRNIVYYGEVNAQGYPDGSASIFIFSDGSYYQGQVKGGKPDGQGKITNLENSYSYVGHWKKGLPDGLGKQIIGVNVYTGQFLQGKKNGKGRLEYSPDNFFQGNFENNSIQGEGKYYNKNNYWEGEWKNGYLEGKGRQIIAKNDIRNENEVEASLKSKETSVYVGEFVKGEKSGFGNFKWNKNYQYEGKFQKGQLHGEGTFKFKGKVYAGVWSNGTQVKISELRRGVPSVILKGSIKKDGNILMTNQGLRQHEHVSEIQEFASYVNKNSETAQISSMHPKKQSKKQ